MSIHHQILGSAYRPVLAGKSILRCLGLAAPPRLRVLLHHDIAPQDMERFSAQLRWLAQTWKFVSPAQFAGMISGELPIHGSNLLLTFDDGLASNRAVAEQVLNPLGISAIFFVVSDLVAIEDPLEARRFISRNIYLGTRPENLPPHWGNMRWGDLEALLEQGHAIGGHTRSHARLSAIQSQAELESEIAGGADVLQQRLRAPIEHFAYSFGNLESFSETAARVARKRFRTIFSGLRGENAYALSPFAIRRDSVALQDAHSNYLLLSDSIMGALLEGCADFQYWRKCAILDRWGCAS